MEKMIKVQNISRKNFILNLNFVTKGKILDLNPNTTVDLNIDEYTYLTTQCPKTFEKGKLKLIKVDELLDIDIIPSTNIMSVEEIEDLMDLTIPKLKNKIADLTSISLLKDIRDKAVEVGKQDKFTDVIDVKLKELSDGSILL